MRATSRGGKAQLTSSEQWFAQIFQRLERKYPSSFSKVTKDMLKNPRKEEKTRFESLKQVLNFLPYAIAGASDIFERLWHADEAVRAQAVPAAIDMFENLKVSSSIFS